MKCMNKLVTSGLTALVLAYAPLQESRAADAQKQEQSKYAARDFSCDGDTVLLARLLFGEARNCTKEEKIAVGYTVLNRMRDGKAWNGEGSVRNVALKPYQYSCFNRNDANYAKLIDPERYDRAAFSECLAIASQLLAGAYTDPTKGATHYFNPKVVRPLWAAKLEKISVPASFRHEFYKEH